jgi:hypothetical protein
MDEFASRHGGLDAVEETDELLVAMPRHATTLFAALNVLDGTVIGQCVPCRI